MDFKKECSSLQDYRNRIYENYATFFLPQSSLAAFAPTDRWIRAFGHYFRGWLPERKDAAIVDLACGDGHFLYFLGRCGYTNVMGVDISPEQVQLARRVNPHVFEMNMLDFLRSPPQKFDCIAGLDIIEHLHKPEILEFMDLCHHALSAGGRLILRTPNADSPWGSAKRYGDFTHEVAFNPGSLGCLLALCGFNNLEAREQCPVPLGYSASSSIRYCLWQAIRAVLKLSNIVETGSSGSGIFTRVFAISGDK